MQQKTDPRKRLTGPQVRARFGDISDMTLWRWLQDKNLGFPKPIIINRRRYWSLVEVETWEASREMEAA